MFSFLASAGGASTEKAASRAVTSKSREIMFFIASPSTHRAQKTGATEPG
jgi:hypothetical protein